MADQYLKKGATGLPTLQEALSTSAGAGDAGKIIAANGAGKLDDTFLPDGVGPDTRSIDASENLSAGDFVAIHNSSGLKVRKADASAASAGKRAYGFVLSAVTSGQPATVYRSGINNAVSGFTPGQLVFLDGATAGGATATPPTTSGYLVQVIGEALSATEISFIPGSMIINA